MRLLIKIDEKDNNITNNIIENGKGEIKETSEKLLGSNKKPASFTQSDAAFISGIDRYCNGRQREVAIS